MRSSINIERLKNGFEARINSILSARGVGVGGKQNHSWGGVDKT